MKYLCSAFVVLGLLFSACQPKIDVNKASSESLDPRFEGNRQMAVLLDSLNSVANFQTNYFLSGKRAEHLLLNKPEFKSGKEAIVWNLKYAFELLNSGNAHGAIKEIETFLKDFNGSDEEKIRIP